MESTEVFQAGEIVLASDGLSAYEAAEVLSGPHTQLTTEWPLYLIKFIKDNEQYLAHCSDMRSMQSLSQELDDLDEEINQIKYLIVRL